VLAQRGLPVLAVDSDPLPGLAYAVGVDAHTHVIPDAVVCDIEDADGGRRFELREGLTSLAAVDRYSLSGPDGLRFLQFGKISLSTGQLPRAQQGFRQILTSLPDEPWHVVGDLPGGTRQPFFGWGFYARLVVVVIEPTAASRLAARRLARVRLLSDGPKAVAAVLNKSDADTDVTAVETSVGLPVIATVPRDEAVLLAEQRRRPLIDDAPGSPAVAAIESLADTLAKRAGCDVDQTSCATDRA
jgi:CO dehydrogenase maturation factor